jgi:hypothetical protein
MRNSKTTDYSQSSLTICDAMIADFEKHPDKATRPDHIRWGDFLVQTSDKLKVPRRGVVTAEFISAKPGVRQGFDLEVDGWFELFDGKKVPLLRTWKDDEFEDTVEYPYKSKDGLLYVWNVYEMIYPSGHRTEERWTENAGFWIEHLSKNERIYHCSHGSAYPPDFESLVFKVSVKSDLSAGDDDESV